MDEKMTINQLLNKLSDRVYDVYCQLYRMLTKWLADNKDLTRDIDLRPHYLYIEQMAEKIGGVLQMLAYGDAEEKAKFIISKAKGVDDLERRIIQFNRRNA